MKSKYDIVQILFTHQQKYQQRGAEKDWKWSCSCGADKIIETRELCMAETRDHLAGVIVDAPEEIAKDEAPTMPSDLSILSYLVREVDCERMTMPEARRAASTWFDKQKRETINEAGRARMRRLKQITDAMNEEFLSRLGSTS